MEFDLPYLLATAPAALTSNPGVAEITVATAGVATRSNSLQVQVAPPLLVAAASPNSAVAGTGDFVLTLTGSGFGPDVQVSWTLPPLTTLLATTFVSETQVTVVVPAAAIAKAGTASLQVWSRGLEAILQFVVTGAPPMITSITPVTTPISHIVRLRASGSGFVKGSVLNWAGTPLPSDGSYPYLAVSADVPANLVDTVGPTAVTVTNPGGATSNSVGVLVTPRVDLISSGGTMAGSPDLAFTFDGWRFNSDFMVRFIRGETSVTLPAIAISESKLTTTIPSALLAEPGNAHLVVRHVSGAESVPYLFQVFPRQSLSGLLTEIMEVGTGPRGLGVKGANFISSCVVQWNGAAMSTSYYGSDWLNATVPAGFLMAPGLVNITVSCLGASSNALSLQVKPASPYIISTSSFSTAPGSPSQEVTLYGRNFNPDTAVLWEGDAMTRRYVSATELQVTIPSSCFKFAGVFHLTVRNPDGGEGASAVTIHPLITSVSPSSAVTGSPDQQITITGAGFPPSAWVAFDWVAIPTTYVNSTTLTAMVPASALAVAHAASVFVSVDNSNHSGTLPFTIAGGPPVIRELYPSSIEVSHSAARSFTVSGNDFVEGSVVRFNGTGVPTTFNSPYLLTASVPASLLAIGPGSASVQVVNPGGSASASVNLTIMPLRPTLNSISPSTIAPGQAASIAVNGSDFLAGVSLTLNGKPLQITFKSSTEVMAEVTAESTLGIGTFYISALNPGNPNQSNVLPFNVAGPAVLTGLTPASAAADGGRADIEITGYGFGTGSVTLFNGSTVSSRVVSSTKITAYVYQLPQTPGTASITVANGNQISNALTFTLTAAPPAITALSPSWIPAGNSDFTMHITGRNFLPGVFASFSGSALATSFVNSTQLDAVVPATAVGLGGAHEITVTNPNGASVSSPFFVDAVLISVNPKALPIDTLAHTVTVSGVGFAPGYQLSLYDPVFIRSSALETTYIDSTTVAVVIPAQYANIGRNMYTIASYREGSRVTIPVGVATIGSLEPASVQANSPQFELTVKGTDFELSDRVYWNGGKLETFVVSNTLAKATVPSSLIAVPGTAMISVGSFYRSEEAPFSITSSSSTVLPLISSLDAVAVEAGGSLRLTVIGSGFATGSTVLWGALPLETTFETETRLTATLPGALTAFAGSYSVMVTNPGGAFSNAKAFTVYPVLTSLDPSATGAGAGGTMVTASGVGFTTATTLVLQGCGNAWDISTSFVDSSRLTGAIPAEALVAPCEGTISARISATDGSAIFSQPLPFAVREGAALQSIVPLSVEAGSAGFALTINGTGFTEGDVVKWNGTALISSFVSATKLIATVPATLISAAGSAVIAVSGAYGVTNSLTFNVTASAIPATTTAEIVNAASYVQSAAPGAPISIFGSNLAREEAAATGIPLPRTLKGVVVKVNGTAAPLYYVSPGQINIQVPFDTTPGAATLVIETDGRSSEPVAFQVTATAPGVFSLPGGSHAIAQNHPDYSLNSPENPIAPGGYVVVYLAGLGQLDHPVEDGAAAPASLLCRTLADVRVKIGGRDAEVLYAGLTPGFVGLAQLNLRIPDVPPGEQPLAITIGGVGSNETQLSVGVARQP